MYRITCVGYSYLSLPSSTYLSICLPLSLYLSISLIFSSIPLHLYPCYAFFLYTKSLLILFFFTVSTFLFLSLSLSLIEIEQIMLDRYTVEAEEEEKWPDRCCCCLPCNHCSNWTWVVLEILAFGTRLRSTHCREFNYLKLCRPAHFVKTT